MERSQVIKKIKELAAQANQALTEKNYQFVYTTYLKIAELCKQIGDLKNANSYTEAAEKFKSRAELASREQELRAAINKALDAAKIANENREYSRVSDIYYSIAAKLYDLGEEDSARKFSEAARKFREKAALESVPREDMTGVPREIQESQETAPISQFTEALKFGIEVEKKLPPVNETVLPFAETPIESPTKLIQQAKEKSVPVKDGVPEAVKKSKASALEEMDVDLSKLDQFLIDLGLKCPKCGHEISEEDAATIKKCPKCGADMRTNY
ncbi:MAG: zinc ribbon domain-containing protein [Candidatus Helarchaeota archaeon]